MAKRSLMLLALTIGGRGAVNGQPPALPPPPTPVFESGIPIAEDQLIADLIRAMDDEDSTVRRNVAVAASELGMLAVAPLTEALADRNADRRAAAAYALGQIGQDAGSAMPALMAALKDSNSEVRRQASYAVGRILAASRDRTTTLVAPPPMGVP